MVAFYSFVSSAHYWHSTLCLQYSLFAQHAVPAVFTIDTACCSSSERYWQSKCPAVWITLIGDTACCVLNGNLSNFKDFGNLWETYIGGKSNIIIPVAIIVIPVKAIRRNLPAMGIFWFTSVLSLKCLPYVRRLCPPIRCQMLDYRLNMHHISSM